MRSSAAARRYARALFALARESQGIEPVRGELAALADLLDASPALERSLFQPLHPAAERRALLRGVGERLGSSETLRHFYAFLIDQRRLVDFRAIRAEYEVLADAAAGRTVAEVVCASPLRDEQRERLMRALSARTGQQVELEVRIDPALLGGAIAVVGGVVFDGSLRTQLGKLHSTLTRGSHGHQAR